MHWHTSSCCQICLFAGAASWRCSLLFFQPPSLGVATIAAVFDQRVPACIGGEYTGCGLLCWLSCRLAEAHE